MKREAIFTALQMQKKRICVGLAIIAVLSVLAGLISCSMIREESEVNVDLENKMIAEAIESVEAEENAAPIQEASDEPTEESNASSKEADGKSEISVQNSANEILTEKEPAGSRGEQPASPRQEVNQPAPQPQKHWVEDTERVWVVDRAAWSEQKPVFESRELCICNVCGADITANPTPHNKSHMLAGEGGGNHSEVKQIQVGSETTKHPDEGHWEAKVVGGHWE